MIRNFSEGCERGKAVQAGCPQIIDAHLPCGNAIRGNYTFVVVAI
jgi:hypothetical protein